MHTLAYIALEAAECALAVADAAYWRAGETLDLLAPRLEARQAVSAARRAYHAVRAEMREYIQVVRAATHLEDAIRARDEAWPQFSRTAARFEHLANVTIDR